MPYFFDALDTPVEDERLWERLQEIWHVVHDDLMGVHFETRDEALRQKYRKSLDPSDMRFDSVFVARYRETDDRQNLLDFHKVGLEALAHTEIAIRQKRLTAQFLDRWSALLSCHGFVVASIMARGDDLQSKRAGAKGVKRSAKLLRSSGLPV